MSNQQIKIFSSVSLVLLLNVQILTSFPTGPAAAGPLLSQPALSLNVSDASDAIGSRSLNESSTGIRTGLDLGVAAAPSSNVSARSAFSSLADNPVPVALNPAVPDQIAVRTGLTTDIKSESSEAKNSVPSLLPAPASPVERSDFILRELAPSPSNVSAAVDDASSQLRSGLSGLAASNITSPIEQRSINVDSPVAPSNVSSIETRSGLNSDANTPVSNNNGPASAFVPSFLKSFGIREKRGEISEGFVPVPDLTLRSGLEQPVKEEDSLAPDVAVRSNLEETASLNDKLDIVAPPQLGASLVEGANLFGGGGLGYPSYYKSPVHPYAHVFPLGGYAY